MKKKNDEISLLDLWHVFAPKLWLIVLCGILCAALIFSYCEFIKKDTYTADTRVLVFYDRSTAGDVTTGEVQVSNMILADYLAYMKSRDFMTQIAMRLPGKYKDITYKDLTKIVHFEQLNDTEWLHIEVTTADPEISYAIAKCIYDNAAGIIKENMNLGVDVIATNAPISAANIIPNSKNVLRNSLLGFLGGAFLCAIVIFLRSIFDVTVHDRRSLEESFDLPVLGVIPAWEIYDDKEKNANTGGNL